MSKFSEIEELRPEMKRILDLKKAEYVKAEQIVALGNDSGVQLLLKELADNVKAINIKLLSEKRLETEQREVLLADRERCLWLIRKFKNAEQTIKSIDDYLEKL